MKQKYVDEIERLIQQVVDQKTLIDLLFYLSADSDDDDSLDRSVDTYLRDMAALMPELALRRPDPSGASAGLPDWRWLGEAFAAALICSPGGPSAGVIEEIYRHKQETTPVMPDKVYDAYLDRKQKAITTREDLMDYALDLALCYERVAAPEQDSMIEEQPLHEYIHGAAGISYGLRPGYDDIEEREFYGELDWFWVGSVLLGAFGHS